MPALVPVEPMLTVAVMGMGYVGLPTALGLHAGGMNVLGIEHDPGRIEAIERDNVDLIEADRRRLEKSLPQDGFQLTTDVTRVAEADAVMICVPTPTDRYLMPDLGPLHHACRTLVANAKPGHTLLLTSTSFVGSTRRLLVDPLQERGFTVGEDIFVASSPERIDPGNEAFTQADTPRVVGGVSWACTASARRVIEALTPSVHEVASPEAAEMTKLYENSFRAVNIALANELADICLALSLDPTEIVDAAATKPFGFMRFDPGPGVGGHCIPCDPHYLLWQLREWRGSAPLVGQAMDAIAQRPKQVVRRVLDDLSRIGRGIRGVRVVVVGVAYKPGVQDVRSSSALEIIGYLLDRGAVIQYYDPLIERITLPDGTSIVGTMAPLGEEWDLALIHTIHPDHDYGWLATCPMIVDATFRFDQASARRRGVTVAASAPLRS
jgi:nucleotide sugar dehydrogenase